MIAGGCQQSLGEISYKDVNSASPKNLLVIALVTSCCTQLLLCLCLVWMEDIGLSLLDKCQQNCEKYHTN